MIHSVTMKWFSWTFAFGFLLMSTAAFAQHPEAAPPFKLTPLNFEDSKKVFLQLLDRELKDDAHCFQKAHLWAYQMNQRYGIQSGKIFIFFTARYQREFDYRWGYHVAPYLPVVTPTGVQDLVFDRTFLSGPSYIGGENRNPNDTQPSSISTWTSLFIYPHVECTEIQNISEYFENQDREYCYILKTNMYVYIPKNLEDETEARTQFRQGDLKNMYLSFKPEYR